MTRTYADYIAMGMDEKTARYFVAGRRRICTAEPQDGHRIVLTFDNGERRMLDCSSKLSAGSILQKVAAVEDFNRVFVDENGNLAWDIDQTVDSAKVWNNRIDFCRDACYLESTAI
ncbi:MAG: DUF2442 domain-containing protein [Kiritimatiellae bacterium]|nr:DUF2442 domain-containing protein [Kiritimatiellia bacterium]